MIQSSLPSTATEPVLVSVVLPAYNHEAYIAQAIDSALAQSVDLELIVIDDASPLPFMPCKGMLNFFDPRVPAHQMPCLWRPKERRG